MALVSEVATPVLGGTPVRKVNQYLGKEGIGIKWATAKDISSARRRFLYDSEERITQEGLDNSSAKLLPSRTVIITARGTVGKIVQLGTVMAFNQTCYGLRNKQKDSSAYTYLSTQNFVSVLRQPEMPKKAHLVSCLYLETTVTNNMQVSLEEVCPPGNNKGNSTHD